jgi:hypothetical protein
VALEAGQAGGALSSRERHRRGGSGEGGSGWRHPHGDDEHAPGGQRLGTTSFMLMVKPDFPARDLKQFLSYTKSSGGRLSAGYGSAGSQVSLQPE